MKRFLFVFLLVILIAGIVLFFWNFSRPEGLILGVNFSKPQAEYLGLDWKRTYTAILDDLKVKNLRLQAYWPEIEKNQGQLDFTDLDWQVKEAKKRDAKIIMVIGRRQPHWPECHSPLWAQNLTEDAAQQKILGMLEQVVKHYKKESSIIMWQVDNEPLVNWFGKCPIADQNFVKKEIALVKKIDFRSVLITDSGELSLWRKTSHLGDYFGTTMYRVVWSKTFGYLDYKYPIPPAFYRLRAFFNGLPFESVVISELQAEPWQRIALDNLSLAEQRKSFDAQRLKDNVEFARRTGFSSAYLWGAEYWYWLKEKQNDVSVWEAAKNLDWSLSK